MHHGIRGAAVLFFFAWRTCWADSPAAATTQPADREAVLRAADRATGFLKSLAPDIDPVRLRAERKMKGKKFYVEYLKAWWDLYQIGGADKRAAIREFLTPVVERSNNADYHNLDASSAQEFKEDIISYLSACVLHEQFGFDTADYRQRIDAIVGRTLSPRHLSSRGIDNTMAIVHRLRQLGHDPKIDLCDLWRRPGCVTRQHPDLTRLDLTKVEGWIRVYDLTHEVFYLTEFGRTPMQCVGPTDLGYIRDSHASLLVRLMELKNIDLVSELLMDLNYLRMTDLPEYAVARQFVLDHQNDDGSWGDREVVARNVEQSFGSNPAYLPAVGQYLHTTHVSLNALLYPYWADATQATQRAEPHRSLEK